MRKLTVKRKWSIVECGSRITLFVECNDDSAEYRIDGKTFKGYALKNGKTVTAEIGDEPALIYVKSSTMCVSHLIPGGTADVTLTTKPQYNPMEGNPFVIE